MTKEELQIRLNEINEKIKNRELDIQKYMERKNLDEETIDFVKEVSSYSYPIKMKMIEDKEEELGLKYSTLIDLYSKLDKLNELNQIKNNYETKISKVINDENIVQIPALKEFLDEWREKAYMWHLNEANKYVKLEETYQKARYNYVMNNNKETKEELYAAKSEINNVPTIIKQLVSVKVIGDWDYNGCYVNIQGCYIKNEKEFYEKLNKLLEKEVEHKYKDLVNRITKVVGEIEDVDNLSIGRQNGEINGIIKGSKGKATIETVSAGGYNIQCFHYRVLIKEVK